MKKTLLLFAAILTLAIAHAQTKKLDCYRGNMYTQKNGLTITNALENKQFKKITPFLSKTANVDTTKLKLTFRDFAKKYQQLIKVNPTSSIEFIEPADSDGKCYYERTYYVINKDKITYLLQVKIHLDLDGFITDMAVNDRSTLTRRDAIVLDKAQTEEDELPPPPPGD